MLALSNIWTRLRKKLQRREYRHAYLAEHVRCGIAYQIRALRDQREWKQGELSKRLNKPQSVVCRLEDPNYGKVTVQTLLEIANVFDVALEVRFVTYSSFVLKTRDVSSSAMHALSFDDDVAMKGGLYSTVTSATPIQTFNVNPSSILSFSEYKSIPLNAFPPVTLCTAYVDDSFWRIDEFQQGDEQQDDVSAANFMGFQFGTSALAGPVGHG